MAGLSDAALRCLLGLIHLSWRFDPGESSWVCAENWLTRAEIEEECGLSDQGTRQGLSGLEERGWVAVDRSSRSYCYKLAMEVPQRRFTYLPTGLLEEAKSFGSATALRVLMAVFRETWGWTKTRECPQAGGSQTACSRTVHKRWARLSKADLTRITGHSSTAISQAAEALEGTWIGRLRPGAGSHFYRILPGVFEDALGPEEEGKTGGESTPDSSTNGPTANTVAPHRQHSCPPSFYKESFSKDKHTRPQRKQNQAHGSSSPPERSRSDGKDAVPSGIQNRPEHTTQDSRPEKGNKQPPGPNFADLSGEKKDLAEKLSNVGVWAGRIAEILSRFSRGRIEANFELYRQRASEQTIRKPGAWLYRAITDGYALPSSDSSPGSPLSSESPDLPSASGPLPTLDHKQIVSREEKEAHVAQGIGEDRFKQCPPGPDGTRFMYFDPCSGGPNQRNRRRKDPNASHS